MRDIKSQLEEVKNMLQSRDNQLRLLAREEISRLIEKYILETRTLAHNARLEIRAGTGGDEAELFAAQLARMYQRFSENQGWKITILKERRSSLNGVKEMIFKIKGAGAYGWLLPEAGIHRVQRIPITEKSGRIHTSAASVVVLPEIPPYELKIDPKDIRVDVFHSSGHGGQSVNTTDSAVRITHLPSGLIVTCQDERSQLKNRAKALSELRSRLYQKEQEARHQAQTSLRQQMIKSGDRSDKIKTYNFPQDRLTDHRLKQNWSRLEKILDGQIKPLLEAFWQAKILAEEKKTDLQNA